MKMKQISDTTLKITMTLDDLMDRGMEIADFLVPQEKTEEFFYAILDELEMPDNFLDSGMLSFRVTPKPDKVDVFVTKSKIDQNLDFEDLADLPDMEELAQMSPDAVSYTHLVSCLVSCLRVRLCIQPTLLISSSG